MTEFRASTTEDLYRLKAARDLARVELVTGKLKRRNLLRHGVKYGLWALRQGGELTITDDGPRRFDFCQGTLPFSQVRQQVFKLVGDEAELVTLDDPACKIVLRRVSEPLTAGFGAGIVFSGNPGEVLALKTAISALRRQPELAAENGGQIMVCGPAQARALIADEADIDYLVFENVTGERTFTTRKKNALVEALPQPRVVIMHARMVLKNRCLSALPREFDVITPRVEYHEGDRAVPYLDWLKGPVLDGEGVPRSLPSPVDFNRTRYLDQMTAPGQAYIDGGLFVARRNFALRTPLNPHLAWGEAEDTEWCARVHAAGGLVDLAPDALAVSQSFKLPRRYINQPTFSRLAQPVLRQLRMWGLQP